MIPVALLLVASAVLFAVFGIFRRPPAASLSGATLGLTRPVSVSQGGITITVLAVRADPDGTFIDYSVEGVCPIGGGGKTQCTDPPLLRLWDGTELRFLDMPGFSCGSDTVGPIPLSARFPPLPNGRTQFYFVPPCPFPELFIELS